MVCTLSFNTFIALNYLKTILWIVGENKYTSIVLVQKPGGFNWSIWKELALGKAEQELLIM